MENLDAAYPALHCIAYYTVVFGVAELTRRVLDMCVAKKSTIHTFATEVIGTAQMCTCVYENGIMIKNYGPLGLLFTVFCLLIAGGRFNRDAQISPLLSIEAAYYGRIGGGQLLLRLAAQTIGGWSAFILASTIWFYTANYSAHHVEAFQMVQNCTLHYKVTFPLVIAFETLECMAIRILAYYTPDKIKSWAIPALVSSALTIALVYVGVPGLNPTVASSRLFGCRGIDLQWFVFVYWVCPVVGWLAGAELCRILNTPKQVEEEKPAKKEKKDYGFKNKKAKKND